MTPRERTPIPALAGRSVANVKTHNLRAVLLGLQRQEAVSRVDLARVTGLSATTITNLVAELIEQGVVVEAGRDAAADSRNAGYRNGAGRPAMLLQLVPGSRLAASLHVGVDTFRIGVTDLFGRLLAHRVLPLSSDTPAEEALMDAATGVESVIAAAEDAGAARERIVGLGVGASGLVDPASGINVLAPNLGWRDVPMRAFFAQRLKLPVFVDNNVRAMAFAEALFGAGRGVNTLAFVYSRVGVGAGFVMGGEVYRGSRAGAGEIGHTTMILAGGAPCRCGNTGCLETLISEHEFVRQAQVLAARAPDSILAARLADEAEPSLIERVFAAGRAGDRDTIAMLNERAYYLGTALANLVTLINPDMIILGGLFAAGQDLLLAPIEEAMRRRAFAGLGEAVTLAVTGFGREVGVIGAAALALDAFFYRQEKP